MTRMRRYTRFVVATSVALLTLAGIASAGMMTTLRDMTDAPDAALDTAPAPRPSSAGSIAVAVVLGRSGTVGSDVLAPYEVFASSPAFSVYTVAESADPAPIGGAPSLLPEHTFAEVDTGRAPSPDVVVVPAVGDPTGEQETVMREWITDQHEQGAHIFGVCSGSEVLAATGLLDGRRATSHWSGLDNLEQTNPDVEWIRGERYVQDDTVTTTAGITSGIPGALKVVRDIAGAEEAARIGSLVDYPGWSLDGPTAIREQRHDAGDLPVALALMMPWFKPTVGVGLTDGVGEIDLAAAFEVYTTSYAARPIAIAPEGTITTRHGIVLAATPIGADPAVDRVVVPGATDAAGIDARLRGWAGDRGVTIDPLRSADGRTGFDAALEDLASHSDTSTTLTVAKVIDYPVAHLDLSSSGMPWRMAVLLALSVLLAIVMARATHLAMTVVRRRRITLAAAS